MSKYILYYIIVLIILFLDPEYIISNNLHDFNCKNIKFEKVTETNYLVYRLVYNKKDKSIIERGNLFVGVKYALLNYNNMNQIKSIEYYDKDDNLAKIKLSYSYK